jgi:hypothetical protein
MSIPQTLNIPPTAALRVPANRLRTNTSGASPKADFSSTLLQLRGAPTTQLKIASGDTLIGIVRSQAQAQGLKLTNSQELRLAQQLASANQISNPDLIRAGQQIDVASLQREWSSVQSSAAAAGPPAAAVRAAAPLLPAALSLASRDARAALTQPTAKVTAAERGSANSVLEKTLNRAVEKGFIPSTEKVSVHAKILQMAKSHGFAPDDFARMTLMESDGMNPRASNQRCHGIIQFCDGPARGAASAGYAANPRAILDLSVHQQLSLVDKYFVDVGLKDRGPVGLEDLYLSVLNPASRSATQATTPLNIQGKQARVLHTDSNTDQPLTRQSIRQGLLQNAAERLASWLPAARGPANQTAQRHVDSKTY